MTCCPWSSSLTWASRPPVPSPNWSRDNMLTSDWFTDLWWWTETGIEVREGRQLIPELCGRGQSEENLWPPPISWDLRNLKNCFVTYVKCMDVSIIEGELFSEPWQSLFRNIFSKLLLDQDSVWVELLLVELHQGLNHSIVHHCALNH